MKLEYAILLALISSVVVIGLTHLSDGIANPLEALAGEMAPQTILAKDCNCLSPDSGEMKPHS